MREKLKEENISKILTEININRYKRKRVDNEKENNRGITLIALVITIIILLILAGVTLATLTGDNGIITKAKEAELSTELSKYKEELELYKVNKTSEDTDFIEETLTAGKTDLNYNTKNEEETGNIKTIITDISDKYFEKLEVIKGKLLINTQDRTEIRVAQSLGIEVNPYDIRDGVLWSSSGNLLLMDENTGSLTIPDSVTSIGEGAFSNLEGLKTIIIPPTVKRIEQNAFKNNTTLENVIIQERNGEGIEYIGESAFYGCTNLRNINLPDTITYIGQKAFRNCRNLDNVKLPNRLTVLSMQVFLECKNLKNLELSESLERIEDESLRNTAITTLKFPQNLKTIKEGALTISTLQEIDTSENNYFEFKNGILYSKDLKTLVIALSNITSINIENSVETINGYAFYSCNKLSTINITENIRSIGTSSVSNSALKNITVSPKNNYFINDENGNLYSKDGTILYRLFDTGNVTIRDGVKNIKRGALLSNGTITGITLPESFVGDTTIAYSIFPTIDYLYLPKNVNTFNKDVYINISSIEISSENPYLQSINNEYILSKDGTELYWVKNDLTEINIPESVERIKSYALRETKAEIITLPINVKAIEGQILYSSKVKKIEIQSKISEINARAFENANNLNEIIIHKKNDGTLIGSPWGCIYGDRAIIWDK